MDVAGEEDEALIRAPLRHSTEGITLLLTPDTSQRSQSVKVSVEKINDQVGSRLQRFSDHWELAPPWTRTVIKRGFHWRWTSVPRLNFPKHRAVSSKIQEHVMKLFTQGAIYKVKDQPCYLSKVFLVPKSSGSHRLIIDLSTLNKFIDFPSFHMSNHNTLRNSLDYPCWMSTVDIQDAYLHVPIRKSLHKFLALSCNHQLYFFRCLPFGLAPAPLVFTALMKFPINNLRRRGLNVLNYLDDLIIWGESPESTAGAVQDVTQLLKRLGFLINSEKSNLIPSQKVNWLGVMWDSEQGTCCLPETSIQKIFQKSNSLLEKRLASRRQWESLMGCIAFAAQLSDRAKLVSHPVMKPQLFPSKERDVMKPIPHSLIQSLLPWRDPYFLRIPSPVRPPPATVTLWCDASLTGWGAYSSTDRIWSGNWDTFWKQRHINLLELRTVLLVLQDWEIKQTSLLIATDNSTTVSAINKRGSPSSEVHKIAHQLFQRAAQRKIYLSAVHIQGYLNVVADSLSRDSPVATEWALPQREFFRLEDLHGSHLEIDLFATPLNCKIEVFATTLNHPRAAVVNAFTVDWNCWSQIYLFPPINLLPKVVKTLRSYKGGGLIVFPQLPGAEWFPFLKNRGRLIQILETPSQLVQGHLVEASSMISVQWIGCSF